MRPVASVPGAGLETALSSAFTTLGDLRLVWQRCVSASTVSFVERLHLGENDTCIRSKTRVGAIQAAEQD